MSIQNRSYAALCTLLACVAPGCDLSPEDDDDDTAASGTDDEGDSDPSDDTDDPSDPTQADDDDDTGPDPDTGGPDSDSDTSTPGEALGDSVFVYIHDEGDNTDTVRAYDVATGESWLVEDFEGSTEIRSVAIHPDRTSLAVSAFYQLSDPDESEGIWRVSTSGGAPENIMEAIPGDNGEFQSISGLVHSPDGSEIYFERGSSYGGSTLMRVASAGGVPEFFDGINATCAINGTPGFSPDGSVLLTVRDDCSDLASQGLVAYDNPPAGAGEVVLAETDDVSIQAVGPQWLADGSGVVLVADLHVDTDGDGLPDGNGNSLLLWNFSDGLLYPIVPPADHQIIRSFAISPDEAYIVMCMDFTAAEDLVLVDLTSGTPMYLTLTSDGKSCRAAW